jgi:hypothetical protein
MASYDNNRVEQDPLVPLDRFGMPTLGVINNSTGSFASTDSSISAHPSHTNANYNKFKSQVEKTIMTSRNPIRVYETAKTTAHGYTGLWLNKSENMNWKGAKNIEEYPIFNDPHPELIQKKPEDCIATSQKITYKFLKPPPIVEEIIIKKEADRRMPELPPLVIRIKQPAKKRLIYEIDVEKYKVKEHHHKHVFECEQQYETNLSACYQPTHNQYGLQMPAVSYQEPAAYADTNLSADFGKQMYIAQEPIVGAHYDEYAVDSGLMQHGNDFSTSSTSSLELRTRTFNAFNKKVQSRHRNNERVLKKNTKTESKSKRHHSVHVSHDHKHKQHHHHHGKSTKNHRY